MKKLNAAVDWDNLEHVRIFRAAYTLAFMQGSQAPGLSDDDKRRLIESNLKQLSEGKVRFTPQDEGNVFVERFGEYPPTLFGLQYREHLGGNQSCFCLIGSFGSYNPKRNS